MPVRVGVKLPEVLKAPGAFVPFVPVFNTREGGV